LLLQAISAGVVVAVPPKGSEVVAVEVQLPPTVTE